MARILNRIEIARDTDAVFSFVTTPAFWKRWHPSTLAVYGHTARPIRLGERVTEEFRALGRRHRAQWTVIECAPPHRWAIDGHQDNLGVARLVYTFERAGDATLLKGEFSYRLPNLVLSVVGGLIIRRYLASESEEAARRLKVLLENENPAAERVSRESNP